MPTIIHRVILLILFLVGLNGCGDKGATINATDAKGPKAPPSSTENVLISDRPQSLPTNLKQEPIEIGTKFLKSIYPQYVEKKQCFLKDDVATNEKFCVTVSSVYSRFDNDQTVIYLAETGKPLVDGSLEEFAECHVCAGSVTFYKLAQKKDGAIKIIAKSETVKAGWWGAPPDPWVYLAGRNDTIGWVVPGSYCGQGICSGDISLYVVIENSIKEIASLPVSSDNCGADENECTSISASIKTIAADKSYFDILVGATINKKKGLNQSQTTFNQTITFDGEKKLYDTAPLKPIF